MDKSSKAILYVTQSYVLFHCYAMNEKHQQCLFQCVLMFDSLIISMVKEITFILSMRQKSACLNVLLFVKFCVHLPHMSMY